MTAGGLHLGPAQLRRLRVLFAVLVTICAGLGIGLGVTLPRSLAYRGLVDENMALKAELQEIDRKMSEVDRMLLRLRLYDAHLRSLGEPVGDHGGALPPAALSNAGGVGVPVDPFGPMPDLEGLGEGDPMEDFEGDGADWALPADVRPAQAWARSVEARTDTFLELARRAEPDLGKLMEELEDVRALEAALPSRWPAQGLLTSGFGWRRSPFSRRSWRFHSGLDIANQKGTPIFAAAGGRVVRAEYNEGYGNHVEIDHGFGVTTLYGHCASLEVRAGDTLDRGALVATLGSTGRSTGPHLHFEVRLDGHPVDPRDYLPR